MYNINVMSPGLILMKCHTILSSPEQAQWHAGKFFIKKARFITLISFLCIWWVYATFLLLDKYISPIKSKITPLQTPSHSYHQWSMLWSLKQLCLTPDISIWNSLTGAGLVKSGFLTLVQKTCLKVGTVVNLTKLYKWICQVFIKGKFVKVDEC